MSDDFIVLVSRDPKHVPTTVAQQRISQLLRRVVPSLEKDDYLGSDLSESDGTAESVGFIVWYRRVGPAPSA